MSLVSSLFDSIGLSPENENSLFLTTSYNSTVRKVVSDDAHEANNFNGVAAAIADKQTSKRKKPSSDTSKPSKTVEYTEEINSAAADINNSKKPRIQRYCPKIENIQFNLKCEWNECNFSLTDIDDFLAHVENHLVDGFKSKLSKKIRNLKNSIKFLIIFERPQVQMDRM